MTFEELTKGVELSNQILGARKSLDEIAKYGHKEEDGRFWVRHFYEIKIPKELTLRIEELIKNTLTAQLEQWEKEFEQLGKEAGE